MRRARILAALLLLVVMHRAWADCGKDHECDPPSAWLNFTSVDLSVSQPGLTSTASYKGVFDHESYDLAFDVDVRDPKHGMSGKVGMVGGRVMVSKGVTLPRGTEIDALDAPVLYTKLVSILLGRALPAGPSSISGKTKIDYTGKAGIKFTTPSASGYIPMPWKVSGELHPSNTGAIAFDLVLTAGSGSMEKILRNHFEGAYSMRTRPVFDDAMPLEGWTIYGIGPQTEERDGGTILDYGAKPAQDPRFKTIADIRAYIAEQNHPGRPDTSKEFTGFWKSECSDNFGISIEHTGPDRKYTAVFCGPGGCGDRAEARPTFITGDRHYEVVSEDEIIEVYGDGTRHRMLRCTKDPHPPLK